MYPRPIATLLALVATAALAGCGAVPEVRVALAPQPTEPVARVARADQPPVGLLDCDGDGLVSADELRAGFKLQARAVSAEEFAAADLTRDGKWSEAEFARFLNHRAVRSWSVVRPCPADG